MDIILFVVDFCLIASSPSQLLAMMQIAQTWSTFLTCAEKDETRRLQPFDANDIIMSDHDKLQMWERAVRAAAAQKFSKDLIGVLFAAPAELDFNDPE